MELQQLRYVLAVAEHRNFTRAAQSCFVVQSALSHQVKQLETELGVSLFHRTSRRVELTAAGEAFLPAARECLEAADHAAAAASSAAGIIRGPLRVGMIPTVTAFDPSRALAQFRQEHPDVQISLRVDGSESLQEDLKARRLDVAFLGLPADVQPWVSHRELDRHHLVAVLPANHSLSQHEELALADLAGLEFADFPVGTAGREQSERAFTRARVQRNVTIETMDVTLMVDLVTQGLAVALLAPGVVPDRDDITTRPVTDGPERVEHLAWSSLEPQPAAAALIRIIDSLRSSDCLSQG